MSFHQVSESQPLPEIELPDDGTEYGSDIIGLNQKEPNSKGDAEFSPVLILSLGGIECKERKMPIWNRASQIRKLN